MDRAVPGWTVDLRGVPPRQVYSCYWFETAATTTMLEALPVNRILFETDFPHPTCLYPDPLSTAEVNLASLTAEDRRKILGENAAALYRV